MSDKDNLLKFISDENENTRKQIREMEERITDKIKPMSDLLLKHHITLYGEMETNGLRGDVKNLKTFMYKVMYGVSGIVFLATLMRFLKLI